MEFGIGQGGSKRHTESKIWPPPEKDMEEDEGFVPGEGCSYCTGSPCSPALAWSAFYDSRFNLRDSFCIGRRCQDPAWVWDSEEDEVDEVERNVVQITSEPS